MDYPEIAEGIFPRHRFMSAYEQKVKFYLVSYSLMVNIALGALFYDFKINCYPKTIPPRVIHFSPLILIFEKYERYFE